MGFHICGMWLLDIQRKRIPNIRLVFLPAKETRRSKMAMYVIEETTTRKKLLKGYKREYSDTGDFRKLLSFRYFKDALMVLRPGEKIKQLY